MNTLLGVPLELPLTRWLQRERDKPKPLSMKGWSRMVDLICVLGGVAFEEQAMLADLHARVPETKGRVRKLAAANLTELTHWRWNWEITRPGLLAELERMRAQTPNAN